MTWISSCTAKNKMLIQILTYFLSSGSPIERRVCERVSFFHELFLFCLVQEPHGNALSFEAYINDRLQHTQNKCGRDCSKIH